MNDQNKTAQLRFLEETAIQLRQNGFTVEPIEGYGEGGMGVARIDGRVVFVHGALRGEKCRVRQRNA